MINPYRPPSGVERQPSFFARLRHALQLAASEYRRGADRENLKGVRHVAAWMLLGCITLYFAALFLLPIIWVLLAWSGT
jgi:hypothetical protein